MSFGNWSGREGVRGDDPWNTPDPSEKHASQCRHAPEPELNGAKPVRPLGRKPRRPAAIIAIVIILLTLIIVTALMFSLAAPTRTPEPEAVFSPPIYNELLPPDPGDFDSFQEFFDNYYQSGAASGVNSLERVTPEPGLELTVNNSGATRLTIQEVYEKCSPSIVAITAELENGYYSWGTGVIFSGDGYIITNSHVLDGAVEAKVTLQDDSEYPARLVGCDSTSDLAVIKIDAEGLTPADFGSSDKLRVGDDVVAIGNPMGEELRGTMTDGIVSAINREVYMDGNTMTLIQTNAQINEGNSGGALIDMSGRVIGITNMKMMSYTSSVEGLGFAIPTSTVKPVVDEILSSGFVAGRPGIGVTVGGIDAASQEEFDIPAGLYVSEVTPGSGADLAGIVPGDIITAADGTEVFTTADLNAAKGDLGVGDIITLTVWRDGEYTDCPVEIMDMNSLFN
ncbi:MAG: S1C family serine protease [Candidatus Heteroscillospira sp.]|jgi:serine protease Do